MQREHVAQSAWKLLEHVWGHRMRAIDLSHWKERENVMDINELSPKYLCYSALRALDGQN
jgi:hypothetical protein